jgi:hypothetical protein
MKGMRSENTEVVKKKKKEGRKRKAELKRKGWGEDKSCVLYLSIEPKTTIFRFFVVFEDVFVTPTSTTQFLPVVEITLVTSNIEHPVDRRTTTITARIGKERGRERVGEERKRGREVRVREREK